jgi:hypothetical protein
MKILFDQGAPKPLKVYLPAHKKGMEEFDI